jgi:hypothetical protein
MKKIKELAFVIVVLIVVAAFVFARATNKNRFSETTENIAEMLKSESVFVEATELKVADYLVIELGENTNAGEFPSAVKVTFEGLTDKNFREQLETSGKKILLTGNESQTAKAWVILNQLGIENLFILTEKEKPETLWYTFIPDTSKTAVGSE